MVNQSRLSNPRRALPAAALALVAMVLAACAGAPDGSAAMRQDSAALPGLAPVAGAARRVDIIEVTHHNIARYATSGGETAEWSYRLGIGDVMQVFVVDAPELTVEAGYRVEADGMVQLPYLGRLPVADRTADEIRAELATRLAPYLPAPQVDLRVVEFNARHVAVVGEVRQPNRQTLTDRPLTAIDAINAAGGFAGDPARASVTLIRGGAEQPVNVQAFLSHGQPTPVLRDGDVLRVDSRMGWGAVRSVPQAQAQVVVPGGRGSSAVALGQAPVVLSQVAASLSPRAGAAVFVLRQSTQGVEALRLGAADALSPALGGRLVLQPGDVITLEAAPAANPDALVAQLTPALRRLPRN